MATSPGLEPLVMAHKGHTQVMDPGQGLCPPCPPHHGGSLRSLSDSLPATLGSPGPHHKGPALSVGLMCNDTWGGLHPLFWAPQSGGDGLCSLLTPSERPFLSPACPFPCL